MQKRQGAKSRGDSGAETSMGKKEQKYGIHTARGGHKVRTLREVDILAGVDNEEFLATGSIGLPGHFVIPDFITPDEERKILEHLDTDRVNPWRQRSFNGNGRGKAFGVRVNLRTREVSNPVHAMPTWLSFVIDRMAASHSILTEFAPNECNAIEYVRKKGDWLEPHVDDRQLSGDIICNLSLAGDCKMTYSKDSKKGGSHVVDVLLPRRALQIQAGGVRYDYKHGIKNHNLLAERRVSITFRESWLRCAKDDTKK